MDTNYLIMNYSEIGKIDFNQISQTSPETLRISNDGLLTLIKWDGTTPTFVSTLDWKSPIYNKEEIIDILNTDEWRSLYPYS